MIKSHRDRPILTCPIVSVAAAPFGARTVAAGAVFGLLCPPLVMRRVPAVCLLSARAFCNWTGPRAPQGGRPTARHDRNDAARRYVVAMTWSFHYGEKLLGTGLSMKAVDQLTDQLEQALAQAEANHGWVWFSMQHDNGQGGVAEERLLISPGIPMCFLEE